jgi:alpha-L-rhamnosidase
MRKTRTLFLMMTMGILGGVALAAESGIGVKELRCEYRVNPLGINEARPGLGWVLESTGRGQKQTAYQVLVAGSEENLEPNKADMWDSGKVESAESVQVVYAGKPVKSRTRCYWKVRVWDKDGKASEWSRPGWWETAMLEPNDWAAKWINDGKKTPVRDEDFYKEDPVPLFRKSFNVGKSVKLARLYISGLGYYESYINGKRIGDAVLDPGWTTYSKRVLYSTYDVTELLQQGQNAVGVMLGNGWYSPLPMRLFGRINLRKVLTAGRPRLIAQLYIEYTDGTEQTVATDEDWKVGQGPILRNNIYLGEIYDARRQIDGWAAPGFDDAKWANAGPAAEAIGPLHAEGQPPVRITKTVKPVKITEPNEGTYIFDMGQNFAGWVRLKVKGAAGTAVNLRYGELLHKDGTLNIWTTNCCHIGQPWCNAGPGAPKVAEQSDTYILKGEGEEVYVPRFTWHAFRYVEVTGFPGKPSLDAIEGLRLNAAMDPVGTFACSNEMFNKIQENFLWTILSNVFSIQSDCPGRERFGYGGDIVSSSEAAMLNFDMSNFYVKAVRDLEDACRRNGGFTETSPFVDIDDQGLGGRSGPIAWGTAHPMLVWQLYQYYGDRRILEEQYENVKKYVDLIKSRAKDHIIEVCISDHAGIAPKPVALTSTAFYYYNAKLCAEIAKTLGRTQDAARYDKLANVIMQAFNNKFLNPSSGVYDTGTQACQAFALYFNLAPAEQRDKVAQVLVRDIMEKNNGHLTTGIFGTKYMLDALTEVGKADVAYTIVNQRTFPGYGYMIENGATTIWESWDAGGSHNHPMFGSVSEWFYRALGGINPAPDAVGFDKIIIRPQVVPDLTWAKATYRSVRGDITVNWKRESETLILDVTIPVNAAAIVYVPTTDAAGVTESGKKPDQANGIKPLRTEGKWAVFEVGAGKYSFASKI